MKYQFVNCKNVGNKSLHKASYTLWDKNGDKTKAKYWSVNHYFEDFPKITGFPNFIFELERPYTVSTMSGPITKIKRAPKKLYLGKVIVKWSYSRWGAPQTKIIGAKGEGKSVLLNFIMALQAAMGIRILTFNDRRMEIRALAAHGWFDKEDTFHPFEIDIFIPKGYEFKEGKSNPLWDYFPNVHKKEFSTSDDIIQAMEPHKIVVVFEEAFTPEGKLRLWNDLVEQMAEEIDSKKIFSFTHHELSRLIPETPSEEVNKLVKRAADNLANFRKDRIGLLATFHEDSEVFYRVVHKIGFKFQKCPVDKNRYSKLEKEALAYTKEDFAIKGGGRGWMKHTIKLFPELPDEFRCVPQRRKLLYPSLRWEDEEPEEIELTEKQLKIQEIGETFAKFYSDTDHDLNEATILLFQTYSTLKPENVGIYNGLGNKANTTLKGKANLRMIEITKKYEGEKNSFKPQSVNT